MYSAQGVFGATIFAPILSFIVCSVAAGTGGVIGPHYASSKSALHGLIHWLAQRYAKDGIVSWCDSLNKFRAD